MDTVRGSVMNQKIKEEMKRLALDSNKLWYGTDHKRIGTSYFVGFTDGFKAAHELMSKEIEEWRQKFKGREVDWVQDSTDLRDALNERDQYKAQAKKLAGALDKVQQIDIPEFKFKYKADTGISLLALNHLMSTVADCKDASAEYNKFKQGEG